MSKILLLSNMILCAFQNKNVDMENDWKLLTLFIGGNDICLGQVTA